MRTNWGQNTITANIRNYYDLTPVITILVSQPFPHVVLFPNPAHIEHQYRGLITAPPGNGG
jgi:hypothetical protein